MEPDLDEKVIHHMIDGRVMIKYLVPMNISTFEHIYNPEHFYCRLRDIGLPKYGASKATKEYKMIYEAILTLRKLTMEVKQNGI